MKHVKKVLSAAAAGFLLSTSAFAALESRFDAINFSPAVDGGDYVTVYGSNTLSAWQAHSGFYLDYAYRPLQFTGVGALAGQRQSVIDHAVIMNAHGAVGLTDWFSVGLNVPVVMYNWYFSDEPVGAPSGAADHGGGVGDISVVAKFRLLDINKYGWGIALVPHFTLPSGDVTRYNGSGHVTGGATLVTDVAVGSRVNLALNLGATMRDDVTRNGVRIDDTFSYGLAANIKLSEDWQAIVEAYGSTVMRDMFNTASTPIEAGATIRHHFGDSGVSADLGGTAGVIDGVGAPLFRVFAGVKYTAPVKEECAPLPPPDPRIQGNKIVLWGKIFYDTNKATIKPISFPVLDDVVDVMHKNPQITLVEVQGHTDARASDAYNLRLSQARAESAMNYLISKGVSSARLRARGYGEAQPISDNTSVEGMSQNRRTEFVIISNTGGIEQQIINNLPGQQYVPTGGQIVTPAVMSNSSPVMAEPVSAVPQVSAPSQNVSAANSAPVDQVIPVSTASVSNSAPVVVAAPAPAPQQLSQEEFPNFSSPPRPN